MAYIYAENTPISLLSKSVQSLCKNDSVRGAVSDRMASIVVLFDQHQFSYTGILPVINFPYRLLPGS